MIFLQITATMEKFESLFEDLDVHSQVGLGNQVMAYTGYISFLC